MIGDLIERARGLRCPCRRSPLAALLGDPILSGLLGREHLGWPDLRSGHRIGAECWPGAPPLAVGPGRVNPTCSWRLIARTPIDLGIAKTTGLGRSCYVLYTLERQADSTSRRARSGRSIPGDSRPFWTNRRQLERAADTRPAATASSPEVYLAPLMRLLQRKPSICARSPPKAPSCQVLSHTEPSGSFPLFPNDFRH